MITKRAYIYSFSFLFVSLGKRDRKRKRNVSVSVSACKFVLPQLPKYSTKWLNDYAKSRRYHFDWLGWMTDNWVVAIMNSPLCLHYYHHYYYECRITHTRSHYYCPPFAIDDDDNEGGGGGGGDQLPYNQCGFRACFITLINCGSRNANDGMERAPCWITVDANSVAQLFNLHHVENIIQTRPVCAIHSKLL